MNFQIDTASDFNKQLAVIIRFKNIDMLQQLGCQIKIKFGSTPESLSMIELVDSVLESGFSE